VLTKFQTELQTAIAEWHNAMNRCKSDAEFKRLRAGPGKRLEKLLLRAVDKRVINEVLKLL
jgi:hypothetical protein